jgi:hypothetical protein
MRLIFNIKKPNPIALGFYAFIVDYIKFIVGIVIYLLFRIQLPGQCQNGHVRAMTIASFLALSNFFLKASSSTLINTTDHVFRFVNFAAIGFTH